MKVSFNLTLGDKFRGQENKRGKVRDSVRMGE